jgi:nucleoporin p58/p45
MSVSFHVRAVSVALFHIQQIERKLSSTANQIQSTPQGTFHRTDIGPWNLTGNPSHTAISTTLQAQHATFIALASKTAALDSRLEQIKALYTQLWRQKTGSMRDPFHDLDRSRGDDFGLDSLHVK